MDDISKNEAMFDILRISIKRMQFKVTVIYIVSIIQAVIWVLFFTLGLVFS